MGFLKPGLKHIGLRYSPEGHPLSLPRRMGRPAHDKLVRPRTKCDFRFYSGIFTPKGTEEGKKPATPPNSPSLSWAGMLEKIELHQENKNSVRTSLETKRKTEENSEQIKNQGAFTTVQQPLKGKTNNHKKGKRKMAFSFKKRPKYLSTRISQHRP